MGMRSSLSDGRMLLVGQREPRFVAVFIVGALVYLSHEHIFLFVVLHSRST